MSFISLRFRRLLVTLILGFLCAPAVRAETWVLVDTRKQTLSVMDGIRELEHFDRVALGAAGAGLKRSRGDGKTPLGTFHVSWFNPDSRFNYFIGLDYPNRAYADQALEDGRIDRGTHLRIVSALDLRITPPQDTPLGGQIGIHGLGGGDRRVHEMLNWTNGCIALDNREIRRLARWVRRGTRVEIL